MSQRPSITLVVLISVLGFLTPTPRAMTCEPIRIPMCRSMPYNLTQIPNLLHHSNQLNALLIFDQYQPLVATNCSDILLFYLCSLFTPVCPVNFSQDLIPPCKDVCLRVRRGCEPVLATYNVTWPQDLSCDELPPYETGVCISPEAINSEPAKTGRMILKRKATSTSSESKARGAGKDKNQAKGCQGLSKILSRKENPGNALDFGIRATLRKVNTTSGGHTSFVLLVREIIRSPGVPPSINQTVTILSPTQVMEKNGRCVTTKSFKINRDYLVTGDEPGVGGTRYVEHLCNSTCVIQPWRKEFRNTIQKWKKKISNKGKLSAASKPQGKRAPVRKPGTRDNLQ